MVVVGLVASLIAVGLIVLLVDPPPTAEEIAAALDLEPPSHPGPPDLAAELGGGPVGTVCVSYRLGDNFESTMKPMGRIAQEEEVSSLVDRALGTTGLDTGTTGCGLRLEIRVSGRRLSASYQGIGSCPSGYELHGTATVTAGGTTGDYALDDRREPPQAISGCSQRDPDRPFVIGRWREELLIDPLYDALGDQFAAAAVIVGLDRPDNITWGQPEEAVVDMFLVALAQGGGRRSAANAALEELAIHYADDADLQAAVPYLIRVFAETYDEPTPTVHRASDPYGDTLQRLTGAGTDDWTPADWHDWWLQQGS